MPRDIPVSIEDSWDAQRSGDGVVVLLTIQHPKLAEPLTIASSLSGDNVGAHMLAGTVYYAIPFRLTLPSDDDQFSRGAFEIMNYEWRVGRAAQVLRTKPILTIELYAARDFTVAMTGDPPAHQPLGVPRRLGRWPWRTLINVKGDTWIRGDIGFYGPDPATEPASTLRVTQDKFPCLFK